MSRCWALLICAGAAGACPGSGGGNGAGNEAADEPSCPERVTDSLGGEFGYDCDAPYELATLPGSPVPPVCAADGGEQVFFRLHPSERLLRVCYFEGDPEGGGTTSADNCRPVACSAKSDCPGVTGCRNGLCQFGGPITGEDALVLCLADIPWPEQCSFDALDPDFGERLAALEACLEDDEAPCDVPASCRQP